MNNTKVFIQPSFVNNSVDIWVQSYDPNSFKCFNHTVEKGEVIMTEFNDSERNPDMKPFIHLPRNMSEPFFLAVAEYMGKMNIKPRDQNLIEGELKATKLHLEDMQKIVNKTLLKL